jgi:hypothetical protein
MYRSLVFYIVGYFILALRTVAAEHTPPEVVKFSQISSLARIHELDEQQKHLDILRELLRQSAKIKNVSERRSQAATIKDSIQIIESLVAFIENPLNAYYSDPSFAPLEIDSISTLGGTSTVVGQIVDDNNVLINFTWSEFSGIDSPIKTERLNAQQIDHDEIYWITGLDANSLTEGKELGTGIIPVRVLGLKTYDTKKGTNTVPLLEIYDLSPHEELFTRKQDLRKWTDSSGKHEFEGIFVKYQKSNVHLISLDGKETKLKLPQLSDKDREYVRKILDRDKKILSAIR